MRYLAEVRVVTGRLYVIGNKSQRLRQYRDFLTQLHSVPDYYLVGREIHHFFCFTCDLESGPGYIWNLETVLDCYIIRLDADVKGQAKLWQTHQH